VQFARWLRSCQGIQPYQRKFAIDKLPAIPVRHQNGKNKELDGICQRDQ
jgi:hypothetical protein